MTEEVKPIELEDDELESVSGGVKYIWNKMHPRDYGASCQIYKQSQKPKLQVLPKSCYTCCWFADLINDNLSNHKWQCKKNIDPPEN